MSIWGSQYRRLASRRQKSRITLWAKGPNGDQSILTSGLSPDATCIAVTVAGSSSFPQLCHAAQGTWPAWSCAGSDERIPTGRKDTAAQCCTTVLESGKAAWSEARQANMRKLTGHSGGPSTDKTLRKPANTSSQGRAQHSGKARLTSSKSSRWRQSGCCWAACQAGATTRQASAKHSHVGSTCTICRYAVSPTAS